MTARIHDNVVMMCVVTIVVIGIGLFIALVRIDRLEIEVKLLPHKVCYNETGFNNINEVYVYNVSKLYDFIKNGYTCSGDFLCLYNSNECNAIAYCRIGKYNQKEVCEIK